MMLNDHILMLGNFGVLSFMQSWNLTRFLTTCKSATSFRIWTFSAFLYISERRLKNIGMASEKLYRNTLTLD